MAYFKTRDKITDKPRLYVMVGYSRGGKSRWANKHYKEKEAVIVSRDDIRRVYGVEYNEELEPMVRSVEATMIQALLLRGQNVIVDETHLTVESRAPFVEMAKNNKAHLRFVVVTPTLTKSEWKRRCEQDDFPFGVVEEQMRTAEILTSDEIGIAKDVIRCG